MMYILTEQEYNDLVKAKEEAQLKNTAKLQQLCTKIANEMPVQIGWGPKVPEPWGCVITAEKNGDEWYCDKCPVKMICPYDGKCWSQ